MANEQYEITISAKDDATNQLDQIVGSFQKMDTYAQNLQTSLAVFGRDLQSQLTGVTTQTINLTNAQAQLPVASQAAAGSIASLRQEIDYYRTALENADPESVRFTNAANALNVTQERLTQVQQQAKGAIEETSKSVSGFGEVAQQALGVGLGVVGVQSIQAAISKMIQLGEESAQLSIHFDGVQSRAKSLFGGDYDQMV